MADGDPWHLAMTFIDAGSAYIVRHSSGRALSSSGDTVTVPYGVISQRYYVDVGYGQSNGSSHSITARVNSRSRSIMMALPE